MQNRLFRRSALERLSSPEKLDLLMQVTSPRAWIILLGMSLLLGTVVVWGFTGIIPITVSGEGILLRGGEGITAITPPNAGILSDVYVQTREEIENGQIIARIQREDTGDTVPVRANETGRIIEILVSKGNLVRAGQTLMTIEPIGEDSDLEAIIYLPATEGKKVAPGMPVQILPANVQAEEVGVMQGWVVSVGEFPESIQSMNRVLENEELTQQFFDATGSAPIEIRVQLVPSRATVTGYKWTTPAGPDTEIRSGTPTGATITISQLSPINLILSGSGQR